MRRWLLAVAFSGAAPLLWGVVGVPGVAAQDAEHVVTASGSSFHASSGPVVVDAKEALALMAPRRHGTCPQPVQESLRWEGQDKETKLQPYMYFDDRCGELCLSRSCMSIYVYVCCAGGVATGRWRTRSRASTGTTRRSRGTGRSAANSCPFS